MEKLTIEEKKRIVEFMGLDENNNPRLDYARTIYPDDFDISFKKCYEWFINKYNPDTDPEQFKEVWNKLTDDQQLSALQIVIDKDKLPKDYDSPETGFAMGLIYGSGLFLNRMPEVIRAILETIVVTKSVK